jgi:hypothetical protein
MNQAILESAQPERRLFVGDVHGCRVELEMLLEKFAYRPGKDHLISLGDILGKGPDALGCLKLCRDLKATVIMGNHDAYLLKASQMHLEERSPKQQQYMESLGSEPEPWLKYVGSWPYWMEYPDLFAVHAGFIPGYARPESMPKALLLKIRTWDGIGDQLSCKTDPAWFECHTWEKPIIFGHWAERGLVDLPDFHGLDTGCVYGRQLTGWCPEENRYIQVPARMTYRPF